MTNEKIKAKRKQLESLREELKVLGMFIIHSLITIIMVQEYTVEPLYCGHLGTAENVLISEMSSFQG